MKTENFPFPHLSVGQAITIIAINEAGKTTVQEVVVHSLYEKPSIHTAQNGFRTADIGTFTKREGVKPYKLTIDDESTIILGRWGHKALSDFEGASDTPPDGLIRFYKKGSRAKKYREVSFHGVRVRMEENAVFITESAKSRLFFDGRPVFPEAPDFGNSQVIRHRGIQKPV